MRTNPLVPCSFRQLPLDVLVLILLELDEPRSILHLALTERWVSDHVRRPGLRQRLMQRHCSTLVQDSQSVHDVRLVSVLPNGVWHGQVRVYLRSGGPVEHHTYLEGKRVGLSRFFSSGGGDYGPYVWREAATEKDGRYVAAVPTEDSLELLYWKPEGLWKAAVAAGDEEEANASVSGSDEEGEAEGKKRRVTMSSYSAPSHFANWGKHMDQRWRAACELQGPLCGYRIWKGGKILEEVRQYSGEERRPEPGKLPAFEWHDDRRKPARPQTLEKLAITEEVTAPLPHPLPPGALVRRVRCAELEAAHKEAQARRSSLRLKDEDVKPDNGDACMRVTWLPYGEPMLPPGVS
jgi:hypothetical protein